MAARYGYTEFGAKLHIVKLTGKVRTWAWCGYELLTTALPPEEYPYLTGNINTIVPGVSGADAFNYGLAHLVDELRTRAG